jgi:lactoylglutathione lyase
MQPEVIDHVNLYIPEGGVAQAVEFYRDVLGFETENLRAYRDGDRALFTFRPGRGCVVHVMETDSFDPPGENFNHLAVVMDDSRETLEADLADAGVSVDRERDRTDRPGADVAIYVTDPFGYTLELRPRG